MNRWFAILPLIALLALGVIGVVNLMRADKPSAGLSDGRTAPTRTFPALRGPDFELSFETLANDRPIAVNLFASWCAPCRQEHPLLLDLGARNPGQLFGLLYKDSPQNGAAFLKELGDPFTAIGLDEDGQGGLEFGLTGVPETFVIDSNGMILLHVRGALTPETTRQVANLLADK